MYVLFDIEFHLSNVVGLGRNNPSHQTLVDVHPTGDFRRNLDSSIAQEVSAT